MRWVGRLRSLSPRSVVVVGLVVLAVLVVPGAFLWTQATAPEQIQGVVLSVKTRPPLAVDSFDLLAGDGRRLTFSVGQLDVTKGFDAGHLVSHQLSLQPVIVTYRRDGDRLVAVRLADGPVGAAPVAVPSSVPAPASVPATLPSDVPSPAAPSPAGS